MIICSLVATMLYLAYIVYLYVHSRKVKYKTYKFFFLNLFDDGINGFGHLLAFLLVTIIYFTVLSVFN